jgi:hypothetical protein
MNTKEDNLNLIDLYILIIVDDIVQVPVEERVGCKDSGEL